MKPSFRKTPVSLCVSTVLTAVFMCLLNGEHYAQQLEAAWPSARPLAQVMETASRWSFLPKLHGVCKDKVDALCAFIWQAEDNPGGDEAMAEVLPEEQPAEPAVVEVAPQPEPQPVEPEIPKPTPDAFVHEFGDFHKKWLGVEEPPSYDFCGFHQEWLGKAEAEKLVDSCPVTCRVMFMGDSLMEDFGVYFYRHAKSRHGLQMILLAKFSTGLCRPDYFNWFELFPRTMDEKKPHIVVFMIGANDGQPVWYSKGHVQLTKPADQWKKAYGERVGALLTDVETRQALPLWVGMPVMGGRYAALLAQTEAATREACASRNVPYVDNRALMADSHGRYQSFIKDETGKMVRVRRKDQEHMTPEGNRMLVRAAMAEFERVLRQHRLNHPDLCRYPEQKNELARPALDVCIPYKPKRK